ncbi:MAG: hypothetical protein RL839_09755 [Gammaproteobacteria bacterium]
MKILSTSEFSLPLVALALVLAGCSVDPNREAPRMPTDAEIEQYNASVEAEDRIICRDEKPVGSRISQRVCRRAGAIEEQSALSQREWRRITLTNN